MSLSYPHAAQHCALVAHPICSLVDSPTTESFGVDNPTSGNVPDTDEAATAPSGDPRELPWELMTASASRRRTPTLDQVARYAGVSRATVSRVVNGSTSVDPALRKIVDEAVADLNYVPNLAARALMTRRTDTIALVAAEGDRRVFGDPFFAQIVRGVSLELGSAGARLSLTMTQTDADAEPLAKYFASGHADGVLLISEHGRHRLAEQFATAGTPVVIGGRPLDPALRVTYVDNDNVGAAREAAKYLRSLGRTRIGTIAGPQDMSAGVDRLDGFRKGLGKDFRKGRVEFGDFTTASGEIAAQRLLDRHPDLDAVFVASDLMALGAMGVFKKAGRRIPDDIAVVGFDDIELAKFADPALTTMRQHTVDQGRLMARLMLQSLGRVDETEQTRLNSPDGRGIILGVELIERDSA